MIALDRLSQIIPPEMALANKAIATSLQQIPGVSEMTLPQLAAAFVAVENTTDLPIVSAFTSAVPPSVANYYSTTLAQNGTGPNGTITVADMLGTAEGWNETGQLTNTVSTMSSMNLADLTTTYQAMSNTVNGGYGPPLTGPVVIPPPSPAAGTYDSANDAFIGNTSATIDPLDPLAPPVPGVPTIGLIGWSQSEISNVVAAYPNQVASLNRDWTTMAQQVNREIQLQSQASLNWNELVPNDRNSIYGLIQGLSFYALDDTVGGTSQLIQAVATNDQTGQSIIGALRQGRNGPVLSEIGITLQPTVPEEPNPPAARAPGL